MWMERAGRILSQPRKDKNKLCTLHAPGVVCIAKGKARNPCGFGVKVSLALTHKQVLMVGARSYPCNPSDGHVLSDQLEQTRHLAPRLGARAHTGGGRSGLTRGRCRQPGRADHPSGAIKSLSAQGKRLLKRRQAI
jgi:IS5 family transposase